MKRLIEKTVFCGLVTAWRLATWPTSRSPSLVKPTTDGVVRPPSALGMTTGIAAFHDRDDRVGRAEVDADDFVGHCFLNEWLEAGRGIRGSPGSPQKRARTGPRLSAGLDVRSANAVMRSGKSRT